METHFEGDESLSSSQPTDLLSQKFEALVKSLLKKKEIAWKLEILYTGKNWKNDYDLMIANYKDLLLFLRKIAIVLDYNSDTCTYYDKICNGILSDKVISDGWLHDDNIYITVRPREDGSKYIHSVPIIPDYINWLKYLDTMSQENQFIINQCLASFDEGYVFNPFMYNQIERNIGKQNKYNYVKLILEIHHKIMEHKIYFVWKKYKLICHRDKKIFLNAVPKYCDEDDDGWDIFNNMTNIDEFIVAFQLLEGFMSEYSNIDIMKNDFNI